MLAYNRADFEAAARHRAVSRWADDGLIDAAAGENLRTRFPYPFYSPNIFIRIGLFVFGWVCASAALGLLVLFSGIHDGRSGFGGLLALAGAGGLAAQEILARRKPKPFFRAGLEEAAAYFGLVCLIAGLFVGLGIDFEPHAPAALAVAVLCAAAALRYADSLLAAAGLAALVFAALDIGRALGSAAVMVLPPIVIALGGVIAFACGRARRAPALMPWKHVWIVLRFLGLLLAYAGGNFFVVRELGAALLPQAVSGLGGSDGSSGSGAFGGLPLPVAWLLEAWTYAVPAAYVFFGLRRKDRLLLDAGLFAVAAAVLTYKACHSVLSLDIGLTLSGLALLTAGWAALKFFRPARYGISSAAPNKETSRDGALIEAGAWEAWNAIGGRTFPSPAAEGNDGLRGGGGKFGGGGAQGGF